MGVGSARGRAAVGELKAPFDVRLLPPGKGLFAGAGASEARMLIEEPEPSFDVRLLPPGDVLSTTIDVSGA